MKRRRDEAATERKVKPRNSVPGLNPRLYAILEEHILSFLPVPEVGELHFLSHAFSRLVGDFLTKLRSITMHHSPDLQRSPFLRLAAKYCRSFRELDLTSG